MSNMNLVILSGRLGKDPERKELQSGTHCATFTLATTEYNSETKQESTEWHNIVTYQKQADRVLNLLSKGDHITLRGKLSSFSYKKQVLDTRTGNLEESTFKKVEIVAFDFDVEVKSLKKKVNSSTSNNSNVGNITQQSEVPNEHFEMEGPSPF